MDVKNSKLIIGIISILGLIGSGILLGAGGLMLFGYSISSLTAGFSSTWIPILGILLILASVGVGLIYFSFWKHHDWARNMVIFFAVVEILASLVTPWYIILLVLVWNVLIILFLTNPEIVKLYSQNNKETTPAGVQANTVTSSPQVSVPTEVNTVTKQVTNNTEVSQSIDLKVSDSVVPPVAAPVSKPKKKISKKAIKKVAPKKSKPVKKPVKKGSVKKTSKPKSKR